MWSPVTEGSPSLPPAPIRIDRFDPPPVRSLHDQLSDVGLGSVPLRSRISPSFFLIWSRGAMPSNPEQGILSPASVGQPKITLSPAQPDCFYAPVYCLRSEDRGDGRWVTVYGFNQASASYILHQFAQYGKILKHVMSNTGNWMHILYQTKHQARKALSKDGRIFGNCIRVGVKPCTDKSTVENLESSSTSLVSSVFTPHTQPVTSTPVQPANRMTRFRTMRPLAPARKGDSSHCQVFLERQTPSKGVVLLEGRPLCPAGSPGQGLFLVFAVLTVLLAFNYLWKHLQYVTATF